MKRCAALVLILCFLTIPALAGSEDALGLYTELTEEQAAEESAAVAEVLELLVEPDMTDGEIATVLHDWVVLSTRYALTYYRDMSYGALVQHYAICRGYARGYQVLAQAAGLDSVYTFSVPLLHAWVLSELDGSYYCVDPTWDDDHKERIGFVNHRHFFFTTATEQQFTHYGEDTALIAEGGLYELAPWRSAVTRVIFYGDWCYYINTDYELIRCDRQSWETEVLYTLEERWDGYVDANGNEWPSSGLILLHNKLWFNSSTAIYSISLKGNRLKSRLTVTGEDGLICGIDVRDGTIKYSLATEAQQSDYELLDSGINAESAWGYLPDA